MDFLTLLFVAAAFAPAIYVLRRLERWSELSARELVQVGVVVKSVRALDEVAEVIGRYMGADIYRSVTFHGLRYEFAGVAPPAIKAHLRGRQLYLEPGLLYTAS